MKKTALYIQLLMAALVMASCNLFIDEELDTNYGDVPERTGDEYDNVVSAEGDGCTINYQLKRDVRHLGERDLQYIRYVQRDEIGALIEIHYAADTPEELLPVPGEVLLSGVNDKFDWGCSHRLKNRYFEDGVYKFLGTICSVKEVYETLEIDGQLTTTETEEYYVQPDADEGDEPSEARTRADDGGDGMKVAFEDDGFMFKVEFGILQLSTDYGDFGASFSMPSETNFTKITVEAVFDDFSLSNPEFQLIKTIEEQNDITLEGTWQHEFGFKKKAFRWHPVKGKVFSCPPLVVVFFVDVELHPAIGFKASAKITRHQKVVVTYTVNLYDATCKQTEKKLIDEPWKVDGEVTITFSLELDISVGFGFYGKVFSVRFVPYLNFTLEASWPGFTQGALLDASTGKGVDFTVELGGRIRFVVDFTFDNLFGSSNTVEQTQANLQKAAELYNEHSEFYNSMKDYEKTFGTTDTEDFNTNQNKEWGHNIDIIKVKLFQWNVTWFPVISDESFTINKYWETSDKLAFSSQYKIKKTGLFASVASYCPALRIMDGTKQLAVVYPEEGGKEARLERDKTYHFTLPDLPSNRVLYAVPSYYERVFGTNILEAVDKGTPFYTITPSVVIDELRPCDFIVDNEGRYASKNGKMFMYIFKVESKMVVEGSHNLASWHLKDKVTGQTAKSLGWSKKKKDGKWTVLWKFFARTNIPTTIQTLKYHADIVPVHQLDTDDSGTTHEGNHYEIMVYSNGTYDIIDDGSGMGMEGLTYEIKGEFARRYRNLPSVVPDERDDVETEVVIDKIIDPDGEVVYECPDSQTI
ncbi:MAG: hypothetical protein IJV45_06820 [Prevotella sp.]|nr:hypothetical protein [Prevotella sp.]